jgi:hypothetical protein
VHCTLDKSLSFFVREPNFVSMNRHTAVRTTATVVAVDARALGVVVVNVVVLGLALILSTGAAWLT